jgi:hypothetical protein
MVTVPGPLKLEFLNNPMNDSCDPRCTPSAVADNKVFFVSRKVSRRSLPAGDLDFDAAGQGHMLARCPPIRKRTLRAASRSCPPQ